MALIIENGSQVVGANSYVTVEEAKMFAAKRGETTYPTNDAAVEVLLTLALDYIEAKRNSFSGVKTSATQELEYPRKDSFVSGYAIPENFIPKELKFAQMQLSIDALNLGSLSPSTDGYAIAVEEVEGLKMQYAAGGRLSGTSLPAEPSFPKADRWLETLYGLNFTNKILSTVRV